MNKQVEMAGDLAVGSWHLGRQYLEVGEEEVLRVQDVTKTYRINKQVVEALRGVNLTIRRGEFVAITGTSGSGKSTLLHILGCLDKPTSGKVWVKNQDVSILRDKDLSELRQKMIGFVFQSFYLQPFLKLEDNIAVPAMFAKKHQQEIDAKVEDLLTQVGLKDQAGHLPKELSGGQMQRVAILRALINDPEIILADEPTGNLDFTNSQAIIDLFRKIREQRGMAIVVVTHDRKIAEQADRVIVLEDGVSK